MATALTHALAPSVPGSARRWRSGKMRPVGSLFPGSAETLAAARPHCPSSGKGGQARNRISCFPQHHLTWGRSRRERGRLARPGSAGTRPPAGRCCSIPCPR